MDPHKTKYIIKLNTTRLANRIGGLRQNELGVIYDFIIGSDKITDETKEIMNEIKRHSEDTKSLEFKMALDKLIMILSKYYEDDYKEIYSLVYCKRI